MKPSQRLCPSAPCRPGNALLGVVQADGHLAYLDAPIPIDNTFVETATQGRSPEKRFRFIAPCQKGGCQQWKDGGCSIADGLSDIEHHGDTVEPDCPIQSHCRWRTQQGPSICLTCPEVITNPG